MDSTVLHNAHIVSTRFRRDDTKCCACPEDNRIEGSEWHHIVPTNLGGPQDGPLVHLCGSCHTLIHQTATKYIKGEVLPPKLTDQHLILIRMIADSARARANLAQDEINLIDRKIQFKVPHEILVKIHKRKADLGLSNVTKYMMRLILSDLRNL